jgi:hypothetical protein
MGSRLFPSSDDNGNNFSRTPSSIRMEIMIHHPHLARGCLISIPLTLRPVLLSVSTPSVKPPLHPITSLHPQLCVVPFSYGHALPLRYICPTLLTESMFVPCLVSLPEILI